MEDPATETIFDDISVASYESGDELPPGSFGTRLQGDISTRPVYDAVGLNSSEFRVLTLSPASNKTEEIYCTLERAEFEATSGTGPVYEALSYAWGDSTDKYNIYVDRLPFPITRNLDVALRYLRKPDEPRRLWIDAICIDQENLVEKTHQVRMMRDIYRNASRVLVWLGESNKDIRKAMAFLQRADEVEGSLPLHPVLAEILELPRQRQDEGTEGEVRNHYSNENIDPFAPGLEKIFKKPWWFRLWVVQEVFVARRPPLVGCGRAWVSWTVVHRQMSNFAWEQKRVGESNADWLNILMFGAMHYEFSRGRLDGGTGLFRLLTATSNRRTTQPHDKIYALLGLATDDAVENIDIDYEQPYSIAYQKAMVHMLKSATNLSLLEFSMRHYGDSKIPSWCVDFSNPAWLLDSSNPVSRPLQKDSGRGASGNQPKSRISHQPDQGTIEVQGTVVGRISQIHISERRRPEPATGDKVTDYEPEDEHVAGGRLGWIVSVQKDIATFTQLVRTALEDRFGESEALQMLASGIVWKAAIGDFPPATDDEDNLAGRQRDLLPDQYSAIEKYAQLVDPVYRASSTSWSHLGSEFPNWQELKEWASHKVVDVGFELMHISNLFSTDTGYLGRFGRTCQAFQPGDLVCILYGCDLPVVLRPLRESYEVVTFVAMNELADGEYFDGPERQTETFTLC
ncbi:MAG: hypothetical protein LQ346_004508 [Caloplaca aetnensis]|nr:MAG: hypothetical protein LQ346_004508 [Caloplaca aetnensis]